MVNLNSRTASEAPIANFLELRHAADLVRSIVSARRAVSASEVCTWVSSFGKPTQIASSVANIRALITLLCSVGDIGFGTVRGERMLLALPERRVELPDGRIIALGHHPVVITLDDIRLFPQVCAPASHSLLEHLQELESTPPHINLQKLLPADQWKEDGHIPTYLSNALALCGTFDPVSYSWSIGDENASFLNEWFGLTAELHPEGDIKGPDPEQTNAIHAPADARILVEAGPGSGKTFVAASRIATLVANEDVVASRILVLSFTRVAVAELRARTSFRNGSDTNSVHIRTFDAFAARLLQVAGHESHGGYDAVIRAATRLLASQNPLVEDIVSHFEHVLIDEAQDLVGDRQHFCMALVDALAPTCGVTVLGDPAQAIYGYQRTGSEKRAFVESVQERGDFTTIRLKQDHRTRTPALRDMFATCRTSLLSKTKDDPQALYFDVRDKIRAAATENGISSFAGHATTTSGLILTRSRRALMSAAEAMRARGRPFRIRLPDRPARIEDWIGATLGGLAGNTRLSRDGFSALYEELAPDCVRDWTECWDILCQLDGSGKAYITVSHIAEALEAPMPDIIRDHEGNSGPLLSTIHAIKGHESNRVMLLLAKPPSGDDVDWAEEARTLYVGATRASEELRTGWIAPARYFTAGQPQRHWAPHAGFRTIEIGLEGDLVDWATLLASGLAPNPRATVASIYQAARTPNQIRAERDSVGRYVLFGDTSGRQAIGCLTNMFTQTLRSITRTAPEAKGPDLIEGIRLVGATTVFCSPPLPNKPPIGLMPLLGGFCRVNR